MTKASVISAVVLGLLWSGCTKETQTSEGNPVPVILLSKVEPTTVKQFKDSVAITFTYEDGDGDLGWQNADIQSLEVKDVRFDKPDMYYVAPLSPVGSKVHIKGTLKVNIKNLFLISTATVETTVLELRIQDRAGHWSNKITTPEITINK